MLIKTDERLARKLDKLGAVTAYKADLEHAIKADPDRITAEKVYYLMGWPRRSMGEITNSEARELVQQGRAAAVAPDQIVELVCPLCENTGMVFMENGDEYGCGVCVWGRELLAENKEYWEAN